MCEENGEEKVVKKKVNYKNEQNSSSAYAF